MQTENLAKNSHKQFYVLSNTNQIKLYAYNSLLLPYIYIYIYIYIIYIHNIHTCIYRYKYILLLLFSITISAATVIKATKYSRYYIIHNSYDVATKLRGVCRLFLIYSQKLLWKTKILAHGHVKVFLNSVKFPLIVSKLGLLLMINCH